MRDTKSIESFLKNKYKKITEMNLFRNLKKDVSNIKSNHLKHMHEDIDKLGGKVDKIYWVLLGTVGAAVLTLSFNFSTSINAFSNCLFRNCMLTLLVIFCS